MSIRAGIAVVIVWLLVVSACAQGSGDGIGTNPIDARAGAIDARPSGSTPDAADDAPDANDDPGTADARVDGAPGGGLDPDLALPDPSGTVCHAPGSSTGCALGEVCRYFTPSEGRCESCVDCGNLHASCVKTADCDILFECFQGTCTNFCTLGGGECGNPADCVAIGHPTRGVCKP